MKQGLHDLVREKNSESTKQFRAIDVLRDLFLSWRRPPYFLITDPSCYLSYSSLFDLIQVLAVLRNELDKICVLVPSLLYDKWLITPEIKGLHSPDILAVFHQWWRSGVTVEFMEQLAYDTEYHDLLNRLKTSYTPTVVREAMSEERVNQNHFLFKFESIQNLPGIACEVIQEMLSVPNNMIINFGNGMYEIIKKLGIRHQEKVSPFVAKVKEKSNLKSLCPLRISMFRVARSDRQNWAFLQIEDKNELDKIPYFLSLNG